METRGEAALRLALEQDENRARLIDEDRATWAKGYESGQEHAREDLGKRIEELESQLSDANKRIAELDELRQQLEAAKHMIGLYQSRDDARRRAGI